MAETVDEISIDWTDENGEQQVKQVKKHVLTKGAWSTIMFAYQEKNRTSGEFGPLKFRVGRYQKRNGQYNPHSKFNISSIKQAGEIVGMLQEWIDELKDDESKQ
ncbi:MAG: hypothetical protein PHO79_10490 [Desulfoplanes sp.]|nr:hypothetical protein [Desulfoplanes sp.]